MSDKNPEIEKAVNIYCEASARLTEAVHELKKLLKSHGWESVVRDVSRFGKAHTFEILTVSPEMLRSLNTVNNSPLSIRLEMPEVIGDLRPWEEIKDYFGTFIKLD
jgi:hypothetical protein